MPLRHHIYQALICAGLCLPTGVAADSSDAQIQLELNTVQDVTNACRLTFVAHNQAGRDIDRAVFETVMFDAEGSVLGLSLFDFRELPDGTPRVRQFDVPGTACARLGRVLINGANTCTVAGADSTACSSGLNVSSRVDQELLG